MRQIKWSNVYLALGILAMTLRWMVYAFYTDQKQLLVSNALYSVVLILTVGMLALTLVLVYKLNAPLRSYPRMLSAASYGLLALGLAATAWTLPASGMRLLRPVCMIGGLGSAAAMGYGAYLRAKHQRLPYGIHAAAAVFLVLLLVFRYKGWSAQPQVMNYAFPLLGGVCLSLGLYWHAAYDCGLGRKRPLGLFTLCGVYFCLAAAAHDACPWLYLSGAVFLAMNPARANPERTASDEAA